MSKLKKIHFKNVEILMTEEHLELLKEHLTNSQNEWLNVSLQQVLQTDENGLIIMFAPRKIMSGGLVFFFQNLMMEQRLILMDDFLRSNEVIK